METICEHCGRPFQAQRSTARFCCGTCRVAYRRASIAGQPKPVVVAPAPSSDGRRTLPAGWEDVFLSALAETGKVPTACQIAGVSHMTPYRRRKSDIDFAQRYEDAENLATKLLEREAWRRASEGVDKPVWYKGEQIGVERQYSDTLLIFLLKARDPAKYRDNYQNNVNVQVGDQVQIVFDFGRLDERDNVI